MYVPESEPRWAQCFYCKNRDLYDNLQPVVMTDRESGHEARACKKCLREMSEERMEEIKADREHCRVLRTMQERDMKLVYAHGGLFHIQDEAGSQIAGKVSGDVVAEMEARKYIVAFRHPYQAHAFELTERGRSVVEQAAGQRG